MSVDPFKTPEYAAAVNMAQCGLYLTQLGEEKARNVVLEAQLSAAQEEISRLQKLAHPPEKNENVSAAGVTS